MILQSLSSIILFFDFRKEEGLKMTQQHTIIVSDSKHFDTFVTPRRAQVHLIMLMMATLYGVLQ